MVFTGFKVPMQTNMILYHQIVWLFAWVPQNWQKQNHYNILLPSCATVCLVILKQAKTIKT